MGPSEDGSDETILTGLVAWLDHTDGPATHRCTALERPAVGFSSETLLIDVRRSGVGGDEDRRLVLKLPPQGPAIFPTYDFVLQARVQQAAADAGVPTAVPARAETDTSWLGTPFLVMPALTGEIFGEAPALDRRLTKGDPERNTRVHTTYVDTLAAIHDIDWRSSALDAVVPRRDNASELSYWRRYLDWYGDGEVLVPALDAALDWCEAHRPAEEPPPSLLWGDVRLGNMIFDQDGRLVAVLDWEMSFLGAGEHDLAWMTSIDATQGALMGRTVPGFLDDDAVVRRYEAAAGRQVRDLAWYEVVAMVRTAAIMSRIAHLGERQGRTPMLPIADNPILDLLAQRIERAPSR